MITQCAISQSLLSAFQPIKEKTNAGSKPLTDEDRKKSRELVDHLKTCPTCNAGVDKLDMYYYIHSIEELVRLYDLMHKTPVT